MVTSVSSLGTTLSMTVASVSTIIAGMRDIEFEAPEVETYETDDLVDDYVNIDVTGRSKGGSCKGSMLWDPASATSGILADAFDEPVRASFSIGWGGPGDDPPVATQPFNGILVKQTRKAERGNPLICDIEIAVARKPVLV